jgi:hypothetical protein
VEIGLLVFGMTRLVKDLFYQEGPLHPLVVRGRFGIHKGSVEILPETLDERAEENAVPAPGYAKAYLTRRNRCTLSPFCTSPV